LHALPRAPAKNKKKNGTWWPVPARLQDNDDDSCKAEIMPSLQSGSP
jgi:hypothetical protein